ncbi:MAG TPA: hydrogenase maturation protease, partial [bacterium]|nr:hydrogenase maturation protease [bacterium]
PGSIYRFTPEDIGAGEELPNTLHMGILDALKMAEMTGDRPENVVVVAVEPEEITAGLELTETIKNRLGKIVEIVLSEVELFLKNNN